MKTEIKHIEIPKQLLPGFLESAKKVNRQSIEVGAKFTEEELTNIFNNSFSGKVRANFFLYIGDLNYTIEGVQLIIDDLLELRKDKHSLNGNPIIKSELLFQCFFSEFFRLREISKIFLKHLSD